MKENSPRTPLLVAALFVLVVSFASFSVYLAHYVCDSDFPIYYYAARTILAPSSPTEAIYQVDTANRFASPEHVYPAAFIYSTAVGYFLAPLGFLPYYSAKATMIFINILAYLAAMLLVVQGINGASGRRLFYPVVLSVLWFPFLQNLRSAQVNSIILLFVALAGFHMHRNRAQLCGFFLGAASLFKVFPVGVAVLLGVRKASIPVICAVVIGATLLLPGALRWFDAMEHVYQIYTPFYPKLPSFGVGWYYAYAIAIIAVTAVVFFRSSASDSMRISVAIPAIFLVMPVLHYYHLTVLAFSYAYVATMPGRGGRHFLITAQALSVILISASLFFSPASVRFHVRPSLSHALLMSGLFISWASGLWSLYFFSYPQPQIRPKRA